MKRSAVMLILVGVVALLAVGYLVVSSLDTGEEPAPVEETLMLADYKAGDITAVSFTRRGAHKIELEYSDSTGKWYLKSDRKFPLEQTFPGYMATAISSIPASRVVEEPAVNTADYGLDKPYLTVTAVYGENSYTYKFGDVNSFNGDYYFMIEGKDVVYTIPSGLTAYFDYALLDMAAADTIPSLTADGCTLKSVERAAKDGKTVKLDEKTSETVKSMISELKPGKPVDYAFGDAELTEYGFKGESALTLNVNYTLAEAVTNTDNSISSTVHVDKSLTLAFGTVGKSVYCMINSSGLVYEVSADLAFKIADAAA